VRRYLRIMRGRAALLPFVTALVGRLPVAMTPLGMVLLVQGIRGSYSIAGVVTAAFAVGTALATPLWGGLIDRFGQPRVIAPTSAASSLLLAALALRAVGGAGNLELVVLSAGVGVTFPTTRTTFGRRTPSRPSPSSPSSSAVRCWCPCCWC
jgi:MFS family permease